MLQLEKQYPGANILLATVTDEESWRIEQQPDAETKAEAMEVLRSMFGKNISDATDILVPRWRSNRFYNGSYSNWPPKLNIYEFNQIRSPVGRVYFTGEHTSQLYYGFAHGAYLAGIDSANMMINYIYIISFPSAKEKGMHFIKNKTAQLCTAQYLVSPLQHTRACI